MGRPEFGLTFCVVLPRFRVVGRLLIPPFCVGIVQHGVGVRHIVR